MTKRTSSMLVKRSLALESEQDPDYMIRRVRSKVKATITPRLTRQHLVEWMQFMKKLFAEGFLALAMSREHFVLAHHAFQKQRLLSLCDEACTPSDPRDAFDVDLVRLQKSKQLEDWNEMCAVADQGALHLKQIEDLCVIHARDFNTMCRKNGVQFRSDCSQAFTSAFRKKHNIKSESKQVEFAPLQAQAPQSQLEVESEFDMLSDLQSPFDADADPDEDAEVASYFL